MNTLTEDLKNKFQAAEGLKGNLSNDGKAIFDYSMLVTASLGEASEKSRVTIKKFLSQSEEQLIRMVKSQPKLRSLIANTTGQSKKSSALTLVKGLETWTTSLWSPEKAFEKTHKPK